MDIKQWFAELQAVLDELSHQEIEFYKPDSNVILPPEKVELLDTIEAEFGVKLSAPFREFYSLCGGIYLQVHNGYDIVSLERIMATKDYSLEPLYLAAPDGDKVIVFGYDTSGEELAIRDAHGKNPGEVIFIIEGFIEDKVYYPLPFEETGTIHVASDFYGFLNRLLDDCKAFARGDEEWQYIGRPS